MSGMLSRLTWSELFVDRYVAIASADYPDTNTVDYRCGGESDEIVFQEAFTSDVWHYYIANHKRHLKWPWQRRDDILSVVDTGKTIRLSTGTYNLSTSVELPSNINL